jgi:hypothetical protein
MQADILSRQRLAYVIMYVCILNVCCLFRKQQSHVMFGGAKCNMALVIIFFLIVGFYLWLASRTKAAVISKYALVLI